MLIRNIARSALIIFLIFSLTSIIKNIVQISKTRNRLLSAEEKVASLEKQSNELILQQESKKNPDYLEKQIRNELKMVKPGENLVILPGDFLEKKKDDMYKYGLEELDNNKKSYNYKEWIEVFW